MEQKTTKERAIPVLIMSFIWALYLASCLLIDCCLLSAPMSIDVFVLV